MSKSSEHGDLDVTVDVTDKISSFLSQVSDLESVVPEWAKLLLESIKVMITNFKDTQIELRDIISRNNCEIIRLNESFDARGAVVDALIMDRDRLSKEVSSLKTQIENLENYSRRSCLLFHGVKEDEEENTDDVAMDIINNSLKLSDIVLKDISRTHRIGKIDNSRVLRKNKPRVRPIIVKFVSDRERNLVFRSKKLLKGSDYSISENLSKARYELLKKCLTKYGKGNCWSAGNMLFVVLADGSKQVITCEGDLDKYD